MDHDGKERTAVCCLSSLNIETWDQWAEDEGFVEDVLRMLDNVLTDFIETAPDSMARAKYSALRERSVGLGVMGFHSFLQCKNIPLESAMAKSWNLRIFKKITPGSRCGVLHAGRRTRRLPGCRRTRHEGPLQPQDRHRAHRLDLHHLRRHQRLHRADPGQCLYPQDPVGRLLGAQSLSAGAAGSQGRRTRRTPGSRSSSRKARSSIWTA